MKRILITGGTGFLGRALIGRLYHSKDKITVVARNEGKLLELKRDFPEIDIIPGDIADEFIAVKACDEQDELYHLAAFKHVGMAEKESYQCTHSNIIGTINLLDHFYGELFVSISTDKAAKLQGVYGASKFIVEKLIEERAAYTEYCNYVVPRYGNVIGSTGSVVPKWIDICKNGGEMVITDPNATRFFFTVEDAVDLIFEAIKKGESGKPYIKPMKSCTVGKLADAIMAKYATDDVTIEVIGLQPGENEHEYLSADYCSKDAEKFTIDELIKMV